MFLLVFLFSSFVPLPSRSGLEERSKRHRSNTALSSGGLSFAASELSTPPYLSPAAPSVRASRRGHMDTGGEVKLLSSANSSTPAMRVRKAGGEPNGDSGSIRKAVGAGAPNEVARAILDTLGSISTPLEVFIVHTQRSLFSLMRRNTV